jgi:vitamin B12 transporter
MKNRSSILTFLLCLSIQPLRAEEKTVSEVFFSVSRAAPYRSLAPADARSAELPVQAPAGAAVPDLLDGLLPLNVRRLNGQDGLATVSMRGFQAKQTAVYLDDVRLPPDITGTTDLSVLPAGGLGRVEALPGAASALYGSGAEGGVLQLFTRRLSPGTRLAQAGAEVSSYDSGSCSLKAGAAGRGGELFVAGASGHSGGFQQNSSSDRDSASGRAALDLGGAGRLSLTGLYSRLRTGLPSGTPVPIASWNGSREKAANSLTDRQTSRREFLASSWSGGGERLSLKADFSLSSNGIEAFQWGSFNGSRVTDQTASVRASLDETSVLGAETSASALESKTYGDHRLSTFGLFAQKTLRLGRAELTPAARLDRGSYYAGRVSPKLGVVYAPGASWKFSASFGRAFQAPTFADLYNPWAAPAPGLKPETSLDSQAAAWYGSPSGWYASIAGHYSDIKDRIALDPVTWGAANLDAAYSYGLEAETGFKPGPFSFSAGCAAGVSRAKTGGGAYSLLNFSPARRFTLQAALKAAGALFKLAGRGVSEQYTGRARSGVRLPEYWVFGLKASRAFGMVELWGGIDNLLDRHYAETADAFNGWFPQPGRTFSAGLNWRLL